MKSSLVWQLELVNYFVKNYNYQIIKLVDGRNQKDNDFWLFNREHKKYTIIRISDKNLPLNEIQILHHTQPHEYLTFLLYYQLICSSHHYNY